MEAEAVAAEDAGAEGLLEADAEVDAGGGAEEAVAVDEVLVAVADGDGDDVAGDAGGEGDFAGGSEGAVLGHEEGAAAGDALDGAEESAAAGELGVGGHLDGGGHPGELAGFGDDGVVVVEGELEDGHGGAGDAVIHAEASWWWVTCGVYRELVENAVLWWRSERYALRRVRGELYEQNVYAAWCFDGDLRDGGWGCNECG